MSNLQKMFLLIFAWSVLSGCMPKEYEKQESLFIVFKTPAYRYADLGFIYHNAEEIKVEMYTNAQALMSMEIDAERICFSMLECLEKQRFHREVLSPYYPSDTLEQIFRGKAVFGGKGIQQRRNGFTQKLYQREKYKIDYTVLTNEVVFRDTINQIVIKLKRLDG